MQQGLHIGIGAWIDARCGAGGRPAFPTTAIPFRLSHLSAMSTPEDVLRAVELSQLANRVGDDTWRYDSGGVTAYLWDRHSEVLGQMETALSTLTPAERARLAAADAVLFSADGFSMSDRYALYEETRQIYQDLVLAAAPPAEVQRAYESWMTIGHKTAVEEAIATKLSLERGSSRVVAASDVTRIQVALETLGSETPFVPTLFTPLSAASSEHWTEADVDLDALESAIPPEVPRDAWLQFRARKRGTVRFRFAAVNLIRGWFSPRVYAADDWRSPDVVADGIGRNGLLPAYYGRLYLAQILDVKYDTVRPAPPRDRTHQRPRGSEPIVKKVPRQAAARGQAAATSAVPRSRGVVAVRQSTASSAAASVKALVAQRNSPIDAVPHQTLASGSGRVSKVQHLTTTLALSKLAFAQAQLLAAATPTTSPPPPPKPTYVVGFGRVNLPACPNPNPNYQWP